MPDKPLWIGGLAAILRRLEDPQFPTPGSDLCFRRHIESLLGVGARRAQQLLGACATLRVGRNLAVPKAALRDYLSRYAAGESAEWENLRRQKLGRMLASWEDERVRKPVVLVEAPSKISRTTLDSLPGGVRLRPQELIVNFENREDLLKKLLAVAIALGRDEIGVEGLD